MTNHSLYETFRDLPKRVQVAVAVGLAVTLVPPVVHVLALLEGTETGILGLIGLHPWLVVFASLALGLVSLAVTLTAGTKVKSIHDVLTTARTELRSAGGQMAEPREEERDA